MSIEVSDGVSDGVQENPVGRARESTSDDESEEQLAYRITWHCRLGSRTLVPETEREMNLKLRVVCRPKGNLYLIYHFLYLRDSLAY